MYINAFPVKAQVTVVPGLLKAHNKYIKVAAAHRNDKIHQLFSAVCWRGVCMCFPRPHTAICSYHYKNWYL